MEGVEVKQDEDSKTTTELIMKLPINETNPNEDPSDQEDPENENPSVNDTVPEQPPTNGTNADPDDFSEYMWMEHEDDYDREVLKELHEEETMNYYCDLFEEAQANGPLRGNHHLIASNPPPEPTIEIRNGIDGLSDRFTRVINFGSGPSRLNPDAPEFVPRLATPIRQPPQARTCDQDALEESTLNNPQIHPEEPST